MRKHIIATLLLGMLGMSLCLARSNSNKTEVSQNLNIFNSIYKELQMYYVDSLDATANIRMAIDAMLATIDPYTVYYSADEQQEFASMASGEFSGIGSVIMQRNGHVELSSPGLDSPARRAGVIHGDIIVAIDGDTLPYGYTSSQASKRLRGPAGTKVNLTVRRPYASDSIIDIEITRGVIRTPAVSYYGMLDDHTGYIGLNEFNERSAADVKHALQQLKRNPGLNALVFDLRDNGGGLLESAVQIASYFLPKGTEVVRTRYRDASNEKIYKTTQQPIDADIPLVILTNGNTASSSEILAGALQDLDRAVIIGERSYGKGLVQSSRPIPFNGILKLTVARYYIPSGRLVQAIDYSHRDENGNVTRIPDSLTTVFHTRAGREVRDGGGITPDIRIPGREMNRLIYNVLADSWAYDYANRFVARRHDPMPPATDFEVSDSIFNDFKEFIDPDRFSYDRLCESGVKYLREAAEMEGYMNDSVSALFDQLDVLLRHDLNHDLDHNKAELKEILDGEISERYYTTSEQRMRSLRYDEVIEKALELLSTPVEYSKILRP